MNTTKCQVCEETFEWHGKKQRQVCSVRCAAHLGGRARSANPTSASQVLARGAKWCPGCQSELPLSDFYSSANQPSGLRSWCRKCEGAKRHKFPYKRNPEQLARASAQQRARRAVMVLEKPEQVRVMRRKHQLMTTYGLTVEAYMEMFEAQGHQCLICRVVISPSQSDIDHCHNTKKIRGLLCHRCNAGLGFFGDDPERMRAAAAYVEEHDE